MKKILVFLCVLCMLMSVLTACASGKTSMPESSEVTQVATKEAATEEVATEAPVTVAETTEAAADSEGKKELVIVDAEWEGVCVYLMSTAPIAHGLVEDSLLIREPDGSYTPNIVDGYTLNEDGTVLTLTIPDDLQYHDGTYVKPEDLKRSIEWGHEVSANGGDWDAITSIDIDGNDVIIHMDNGFSSSVPFYLASMFMPIVSAEDIDNMTEEELLWGARVYGPYYVDEYVSGDHVTLKANPYYKTKNTHVKNKGPMNVDTITVRFMSEQFPIVQGLLADEIDITSLIVEESFSELKSAGDIEIVSLPSDGVISLLLNNDFELFKDEKVRQAIMYMINREQIEEYSNSTLNTAYSLLANTSRGYDASVEEWFKETYSNKPDMAKQLLTEAGWADTDGDGYLDKDGQTLEFTVIDYRKNALAQQLLQIEFQEFGIKMDLELVEFAAWKDVVMNNDTYEAALASYYWGEGASTLPNNVRDPNVIPADSDYYKLSVAAGKAVDPEENKALLSEAQKILLSTTYRIPIVQPNRTVVFRDDVYKNIYYNYAMWRFWLSDVK